MSLSFSVTHTDPATAARCGVLETPHGLVHTPVFMPVGTYGAVKGMRADDLEELGAEIILGNAYHLSERPGAGEIQALGGVQAFMGWDRAVLTDSGGYQVFSLAEHRKIDDDGVTFQSTLDGSRRRLTPESVVDIQAQLGSDIAMVLDECVASPADRRTAEAAVRRTQSWAVRSRAVAIAFRAACSASCRAASTLTSGRGTPSSSRLSILTAMPSAAWRWGRTRRRPGRRSRPRPQPCPRDKPRYVMGMGTPADLLEGVARGVDMFDCVMPTRHARNGTAFTSEGRISIKNRIFAADPKPLDPSCACPDLSALLARLLAAFESPWRDDRGDSAHLAQPLSLS